MKHSVMIKGNKMGLILWLDPNTEYSVLYEEMMQKFQASSSFFSFSKPIALKFEGKRLEQEQISEILDGISNLTSLQIAYIIDEDIAIETKFHQLISEQEEQKAALLEVERQREQLLEAEKRKNDGIFYKGTLRSGQSVTSDSSVVVIGDVNPGATVSAAGNVVMYMQVQKGMTARLLLHLKCSRCRSESAIRLPEILMKKGRKSFLRKRKKRRRLPNHRWHLSKMERYMWSQSPSLSFMN